MMTNTKVVKTIVCIFIFPILFSCSSNISSSSALIQHNKKNLIILIGDGMGCNHITAGEYINKQQYKFKELTHYSINTQSIDVDNNLVTTDSAASATALACGKVTINGYVGKNKNAEDISNIMTYAQAKNYKTGIISTDYVSGATPSSFSAHSISRNNTEELFASQLNSGVNLIAGQMNEYYLNNRSQMQLSGYNYTTSINNLRMDENYFLNPGFGGVSTNFDGVGITEKCIHYLMNTEGFVLMIEEAYIDKYSHSNDIDGVVKSMQRFNKIIDFCIDFAKKDTNTAVIITSDHETGKLDVSKDGLSNKYTVNGEDLFTYSWGRTGHSSNNVDMYCYGVVSNASMFTYYNDGVRVKNSDLFNVFQSVIK